jgi:chemotaxis protein methyltransferase CheR
VTDGEGVAFLQWALPQMRMRWVGFRKVRGQVRKRLSRRLRELALATLEDYREYLEAHPGEWAVLDGCCRITISSFYRDRAVFDTLRDPLLPELGRRARARGRAVLRAWSAGCASGEEPYTLSLAWELDAQRQAAGIDLEIVASELDPAVLARARAACYAERALEPLPPEWVEAGFERLGEEEMCVRPRFRRRVQIVEQDIREEMPAGMFDLLLCRNLVFTYFEASLQADLLERLLRRMAPAGVLVIGAHETLPPGGWPLERLHGHLPILSLRDAGSIRPNDARAAGG